MINLIVELSRYVFILFIAMYTFLCYSVLRKKNQEEIYEGIKKILLSLSHLK